jgi:hypothetical protein
MVTCSRGLPLLIRMEDLGYVYLWEDASGVKARPSYAMAFYEGALLSPQYPGIREEHQRILRIEAGQG